MAATRTFTANFVGRTDNLEKSFKRVGKGSALMSDKLMRATRMAGIGFGALAGVTIGAAAALKPMIDKAAQMEEALSKNQLLLGESSKAVEAFADTSLESFGVTNLAALQATGVFANLGKAMNLSEADSASMATTLTGLAGDLSSLHDVSVETALTALRAGLIGEAEPLRKFGIFLDAATLKSKALTMGLIKNTKEALTPGIKSQAAYALILQEGAIAMGDFARTADSATNVSKQLAGQWEEIQIQIGTALLPAFTALVTHLVEEVMPSIEEFFEDPSWAAMGKLSAEALTSEFSKTAALIFLDIAPWLTNPLQAALSLGLGKLRELAFGSGEEVATALTRGFAAAITQFGRDNPDWYRGDWDPEGSGTADGTTYGAAFAVAAAGAMIPGPLVPGFGGGGGGGTTLDPGERGERPGMEPAGPMVPGPLIPAPSGGGGFTMDPGQRAQQASAALTEEEALGLLSGEFTGRFGGVTVVPDLPTGGGVVNNFNITGVSPSEVVENMGKYIDMNGPLPDWWTQ